MPVPHPKSYTLSFELTLASLHITSVTSLGVVHQGAHGLSGGHAIERIKTRKITKARKPKFKIKNSMMILLEIDFLYLFVRVLPVNSLPQVLAPLSWTPRQWDTLPSCHPLSLIGDPFPEIYKYIIL